MLKTANQIADDVLYKMARKRKLQDIPPEELTEKQRKKLLRRTVGKYLFLGPGIGLAHDIYRKGSGKTTGFDLLQQSFNNKAKD